MKFIFSNLHHLPPDGFTHWGFSTYDLGSLVDDMNREVSKHPDYDLIIVDTK